MSDVVNSIRTISSSATGTFAEGDDVAWIESSCPHCHATPLLRIAYVKTSGSAVGDTEWLRCPACKRGSLREYRRTYPSRQPLSDPDGVPDIDLGVWREVRACLGVGAYTAAVMLCRKLLFHIAVEHGMPPKSGNGRAPSFKEAVEHLLSEGIVSKRMMGWVERVKDVGNDANHEVTPIDKDTAMDVAKFTHQLLVLAYELQQEIDGAATKG